MEVDSGVTHERRMKKGILIDSGAAVTCADGDEEFPEYPLEASLASKRGETYIGPGSERIPNRGQRRPRLRLGSATGRLAGITFQDAPVRRPILSVGESTDAGNMMIFDKTESVILPKGAPEIEEIRKLVRNARNKLMMTKERGIYKLDAWVVPPKAPFQRPV